MIERSKVKYLRPSRTKAQAQPGDYAHMFRFLEKKIFNTGVKSLPKVEKLASTAGALPKDKAISAWQTYEYCTDWYTAGVNNGEIDWSTLHSSGYSTCYTETVWVDDDNPYTPPYGASDPPPFSGGGGGSNGSSPALDPNSFENDLPLPCENVGEPNFRDTINVKSLITQEALKTMLPYQYHAYIAFDDAGNLKLDYLKSAEFDHQLPKSEIYEALLYLAQKPDININIYLSTVWRGRTTRDPNGARYSWETKNQSLSGVTIIPGDIPNIEGVPVTGSSTSGDIFIKDAEKSSMSRLSFIVAHELLGHMYRHLKELSYSHGDTEFENWVSKIETQANKNWRMLKKWEKSKQQCQ